MTVKSSKCQYFAIKSSPDRHTVCTCPQTFKNQYKNFLKNVESIMLKFMLLFINVFLFADKGLQEFISGQVYLSLDLGLTYVHMCFHRCTILIKDSL